MTFFSTEKSGLEAGLEIDFRRDTSSRTQRSLSPNCKSPSRWRQ